MAADLGAKFVRINAAKKAAGDLRERASNCKNAYLRDEGDAMVNEALQVIRQIEDKVPNSTYCCTVCLAVLHMLSCSQSLSLFYMAPSVVSTQYTLQPHMTALLKSASCTRNVDRTSCLHH